MESNTQPVPLVLTKLEFIIADLMQVPVDAIRGDDRRREYATARHIVWAIARQELKYEYTRLARIYGKDHSSIMAGVRKLERATELYGVAMAYINTKFPDVLTVDSLGKRSAKGVKKKGKKA